jgi:hypothetical protein
MRFAAVKGEFFLRKKIFCSYLACGDSVKFAVLKDLWEVTDDNNYTPNFLFKLHRLQLKNHMLHTPMVDLSQSNYSTILAHILSNIDMLHLYKIFYPRMYDFFNNRNTLHIIASKHGISGSFVKFIDLLLEYDMIYATNYIYPFNFGYRFHYLLKTNRINLIENNKKNIIDCCSYYYYFGGGDDNFTNNLYYLVGVGGVKNSLRDFINENQSKHCEIGMELSKVSTGEVNYLLSSQLEKLEKFAELGKLDNIRIFFSQDVLCSVFKGACISGNIKLIKGILSIKKINRKGLIKLCDNYPSIINPIHLKHLHHTAYLPLDIFKEIENHVPVNYYDIAESCCSYYGNYEVFIYVTKKLKSVCMSNLIALAINHEK